MINDDQWQLLHQLFKKSFSTNFHYGIASINPDGSPHLTPIGSLFLRERPKAIFFEVFASRLPQNLEKDGRVCVLAVNSGKVFWLKSLLLGRFAGLPGVRLAGRAGVRRRASPEEVGIWRRRVRLFRPLKGYKLLWEEADWVRELSFDTIHPLQLDAMTAQLTL